VHAGTSDDEVLVFAHTCHPSLANDNLAGLAVATHLAAFLRGRSTRYTYRFVFAPATIGSITWLALNRERWPRIRHGLVLALLGVPAPLAYKPTRDGASTIDRIARHVLATEFTGARMREFSPWGYDERQYATPGVNLPVGSLTRSGPGEFPEYHTSADDLSLLDDTALGESWLACVSIVAALESDATYVNLSPCGEPQLGRRGLYGTTGGHANVADRQLALLWVLNQSDGSRSLLDVAERARLPFPTIAQAAHDLEAAGLLRRAEVSR
jgi:aminopeptidase-like protein